MLAQDKDWRSIWWFEIDGLGRKNGPVFGSEQLPKTAEKDVLVNQDGLATLAATEAETDGGIEAIGLL